MKKILILFGLGFSFQTTCVLSAKSTSDSTLSVRKNAAESQRKIGFGFQQLIAGIRNQPEDLSDLSLRSSGFAVNYEMYLNPGFFAGDMSSLTVGFGYQQITYFSNNILRNHMFSVPFTFRQHVYSMTQGFFFRAEPVFANMSSIRSRGNRANPWGTVETKKKLLGMLSAGVMYQLARHCEFSLGFRYVPDAFDLDGSQLWYGFAGISGYF